MKPGQLRDAADIDGEMAAARSRRTEAQAKLDATLASIEDGAPYAVFKARADGPATEIAQADGQSLPSPPSRHARCCRARRGRSLNPALADMDRLLGGSDRAHDPIATLIERLTVNPDDEALHRVRL